MSACAHLNLHQIQATLCISLIISYTVSALMFKLIHKMLYRFKIWCIYCCSNCQRNAGNDVELVLMGISYSKLNYNVLSVGKCILSFSILMRKLGFLLNFQHSSGQRPSNFYAHCMCLCTELFKIVKTYISIAISHKDLIYLRCVSLCDDNIYR